MDDAPVGLSPKRIHARQLQLGARTSTCHITSHLSAHEEMPPDVNPWETFVTSSANTRSSYFPPCVCRWL
eukprot:4390163-Pyramimonas_sp.AAC.2